MGEGVCPYPHGVALRYAHEAAPVPQVGAATSGEGGARRARVPEHRGAPMLYSIDSRAFDRFLHENTFRSALDAVAEWNEALEMNSAKAPYFGQRHTGGARSSDRAWNKDAWLRTRTHNIKCAGMEVIRLAQRRRTQAAPRPKSEGEVNFGCPF